MLLPSMASSTRSTVRQIAQKLAQVEFRVSGLEAVLESGLDLALRLGPADDLGEEIGVATEVFGQRERDGIHPVLYHEAARGRKAGDPVRERSDETVELPGRQRPVDPAVALGQFR